MNLSHQTALIWIHLQRDGRLDVVSRQALAKHLAACPSCRSSSEFAEELEREASRWMGAPPLLRVTDRQIVDHILQARRRQQLLKEPLKGLAWAAVLVWLVLWLSWSIQSLLPGVGRQPVGAVAGRISDVLSELAGKLEQGLQIAPPYQVGPVPWVIDEWIFAHLYIVGLIPLLLAGLLGIYLGARQAETTWLFSLLGSVLIVVVAVFWGLAPQNQGNVTFELVSIPFLATVVGMLVIHLWNTPRLWTRRVLALLLAWTGALVVLLAGPWYGDARNEIFARSNFLVILVVGLLPACLWQAWGWKEKWRWVFPMVFLIGLVGMAASILRYYSSLPGQLPWLGGMADLGLLLWPAISVVTAARLLFAWLSSRNPFHKKRLLLGTASIFLLMATLAAQLRVFSIQDSVAEDAVEGIFLLLWTDVAALLACVAIAWALRGRRLGACALLILVFAAALIPTVSVPYDLPAQVNEQRAAQINAAIQRFHGETGRYPASLTDLSPRTLVLVPPPITHWQTDWCYDGGEGYYRLGYATPEHFTYPGEIEARLYASAGVLPSLTMPCQVELERIRDRAR
jgi:hypothetical protein